MLIRQPLTINNRVFIKTFAFGLKSEYSDWTVEDVLDKLKNGIDIEYAIENHYYIVNQDNQKYSEAHDPIEFKDERIYTETDIPVEGGDDMDEQRLREIENRLDQHDEDIEANKKTVEEPNQNLQEWNENNVNYKVGNKIFYNNDIYEVLQDHTSQSDWKPDSTIGLFKKITEL